MPMWNPWIGCHKFSEGCRFCYIHKGDAKRNVDTNNIRRTKSFEAPLVMKNNEYKWKSGSTVYLCFSSDFLIEEADEWRPRIFEIMRIRDDLNFVFLTKRIHRLAQVLPEDWLDGYDNVTIGCTVENQDAVNKRLHIFNGLKIKHKNIICQPLIGPVNLDGYLDDVELVLVGGESDRDGRELDYQWVLDIRKQCIEKNVNFEFRQCASNFVKDGRLYSLNTKEMTSQARKANINYYSDGD